MSSLMSFQTFKCWLWIMIFEFFLCLYKLEDFILPTRLVFLKTFYLYINVLKGILQVSDQTKFNTSTNLFLDKQTSYTCVWMLLSVLRNTKFLKVLELYKNKICTEFYESLIMGMDVCTVWFTSLFVRMQNFGLFFNLLELHEYKTVVEFF